MMGEYMDPAMLSRASKPDPRIRAYRDLEDLIRVWWHDPRTALRIQLQGLQLLQTLSVEEIERMDWSQVEPIKELGWV